MMNQFEINTMEDKTMEGIQPTLPIGGYNEGFGGSGIWLFAILALMWGGFGGTDSATETVLLKTI